MSAPTPFEVNVQDAKLAEIRAGVARYKWFPAPANEQGFDYGMSTEVMKDIQRYWLETQGQPSVSLDTLTLEAAL